MPSDDLKHYATAETDFYELLGITFETSQKDIDRAWRKTALKYHPDKQSGNDPTAKEKFHLAQIGYDLLSDPTSKAIYDNARSARLQRKRQNELFEGRRRQMKDDLEARERGIKRPREEDDEEKLEREIRRLAEDGKRRRKEREDALRRDIEKEADDSVDPTQTPKHGDIPANASSNSHPGLSELDRTIKVRWPVDGEGGSITADRIKALFLKFGQIESADLLKPKLLRLEKKHKKHLAITCMIQYKSVVGAHAAVEDFPKQHGSDWTTFDSVFWAANKAPHFLSSNLSNGVAPDSPPSTPKSDRPMKRFLDPSAKGDITTPADSPHVHVNGLKKKPSFASFSTAAAETPKGLPFGKGLGSNSPSLEEMTMIRLKNAEKRRLAAEIEKQEAEEDAAAVEK